MNDVDNSIASSLDKPAEAQPKPFEQAWEQSFSQAQFEANLELRLKLKTELLLAGILTVASTVGIGLLLRFAEMFARQPLWQIAQ